VSRYKGDRLYLELEEQKALAILVPLALRVFVCLIARLALTGDTDETRLELDVAGGS